MSVINKMLQELDRRNAMAGAETVSATRQVKAVTPLPHRDGWLWRILALLVLAAVAWAGWVAYQLRPRPPLVTEKALQAEAQARKPAAAAPAVPAPEPKPQPLPQAPETFKLARKIETPVTQRAAAPVKPQAQRKAEPANNTAPAPAAPKSIVDKRELGKAKEPAEAQFRRAAALLNQGRVSEAEEQLVGALKAEPAHQAARQAYIALLLEQQRMDAAESVLRETLETNPAQPAFALALARLYAERRDYATALDVMNRTGPATPNAEFQALRGALLQRLGRHAEAVDAYRRAAESAPQAGSSWAGLAISLEALGRNSEALEAYRHALGAAALNTDVREYAEARLKALE